VSVRPDCSLHAALALVALLTAVAAPAAAADPPAAAPKTACPEPGTIVRRLQERYDQTRAFRADFVQETQVVALGDREQARGTVAFQKPGRMHWHFTEPTPQEIVSDGTTLWIYQPAERQVLRAAFRAAFVSTTPVSFLAGVGRISDDFRAGNAPRPCTAERAYVLLLPKNGQDLGSLELTVDRAAFDIVGAAVTDPLGNVTTVTFSKLERNVEIPEDTFEFEVPAGVDVVVAPGG
jgi:outer membrane lipoprotein carrier protein